MKQLTAGLNTTLQDHQLAVDITTEFAPGFAGEVDKSIFLLGKDGKVRSDSDFIFYNQPETGDGSVKMTNDQFMIDLSRVPADVEKLAITIVLDGEEAFSKASSIRLSVKGVAEFSPDPKNLSVTSLILGQFYRHNSDWKFKAIGAGFEGGLAPLATNYGVHVGYKSETDTPTPASAQAQAQAQAQAPKIDIEEALSVKLEQHAPKLIDFAKPIALNLKKHNMEDVTARVAFVLDGSGSMYSQYHKGHVQQVLERIVPLALQLDNDGQIEFWAFASKFKKYGNVSVNNYENYIERTRNVSKLFPFTIFRGLGAGNNEKDVMEDVVRHFAGTSEPVLVIFISDGGITQSRKIEKVIRETCRQPIFWQFVGLGGQDYGILENLDDLQGRDIDNSDFFNIDNFANVTDDSLYAQLLSEFPGWLRTMKSNALL
ncbi:VWA domain-containing protein [Cobetia sp. SIMBA_158]|uniref:VWA domain-containing protein n=1 Tax=Cobetia sp. SIMBA_158 TaxID=3081617 RepID=UPI0039816650